MYKQNVIYTYNGILFKQKKEVLIHNATEMNLDMIMLSEQKDKYHDSIYMKHLE